MGNEFVDMEETSKTVKDNEFGDDAPPTPKGQDDLISSGQAGTVYDYTTAPETTRAPPRVDISGQEATITKADIVLPPSNQDWDKSRDGTKLYKYCTFILFYDKEGQQERFSGVRVFQRDDGKYSHPSFTRDRVNQASELLGLYADKVEKDINEISLREFMGFLNSKPKVLIKGKKVTNPTTNEEITKNLVEKFL